MVHLFLNTDDYLTGEAIKQLKAELGDPELASLNISDLSDERVSAAELLAQASMMPFLCERRLVLARGYLAALAKRMKQSQKEESAAYLEAATLIEGLASVPESCDLILVDTVDAKDVLWKGFTIPGRDGKPDRKVSGLPTLGGQPGITLHALPTPKDPSGWIRQHAAERGIQLQPHSIRLLADFIGADLRRQQVEIEKLSIYAGKRPITPDDVRLLVSDTKEETVWALMDALSAREGAKAMRELHTLWRDDQNPFGLLSQIATNYRTIIRTKTLMAPPHSLRDPDEIARRIKGSKYPVQKAMAVTGRYSFSELDDIVERLLEANRAMVTGADQHTELELLVAELTLTPQAKASPAPVRA